MDGGADAAGGDIVAGDGIEGAVVEPAQGVVDVAGDGGGIVGLPKAVNLAAQGFEAVGFVIDDHNADGLAKSRFGLDEGEHFGAE